MGKLLIAVDLAKDVFELAVATAGGHVQERKRLTRAQFEGFWSARGPCQVVIYRFLRTVLRPVCSGTKKWFNRQNSQEVCPFNNARSCS